MSVTHWWLGEATSTSATVVCRSNATASVSVTVGGQTFTGAADTSVKDGIVAVSCTGLAPGTRYNYQIDGVAGGTLKTQDAAPTEALIVSGSCWAKAREDVLGYKVLEMKPDLMLALGDWPYCNTTSTLWGESTVKVTDSVANGQDVDIYYAHHRQQRAVPGSKDLIREVPLLYMADDHEWPFDNARKLDLTGYRADVVGAGAATQGDLDIAWAASAAASEAYSTGFTFGFTSDVTPADSDAVYASYKIGELIEVFLIDCIKYADTVQTADTASKTMLGAAQKARLIDAVTQSTATWKLIASGKQFFKGGPNTDTWNANGINTGYETEKAEIIAALADVTGLLVVAGDQHLPTDQWVSADALGAGMPAISCLVGCPSGVDFNATEIATYETGVRTKFGHPTDARDNAVAVFRFTPTRAYRYLMTTRLGMISCGYINAGSNQVQYQRVRIG